jgi:hypothetical protein
MKGGMVCMLLKIEGNEILTKRQAMEKYRDKFFCMIITETVDTQTNDLGYVIYTADSERELRSFPRKDYDGLSLYFTMGIAAEPWGQIGGVYFG